MKRCFLLLLALSAVLAWTSPAGATTYGAPRVIPSSNLLFATGLAVDPAGNLYIADSWNSSVWRISAGGVQTRIPPPYPSSSSAYGVALDAAGNIFVSGNAVVWQVDPNPLDVFGSYHQVHFSSPNVESPEGLWADNHGNLYTVDEFYGRVDVYNFASGITSQLPFHLRSPFYDGSYSGAYGVVGDAAGDIFVTDTENSQVLELTTSGHIVTVPFTGLLWPRGIAIDAAGDLFVADSGNGRVVELKADGTQVTLPFPPLGTWDGSVPQDVGGVIAVAVDPAGDVYALDRGPSRIWELSPVSPQAITFTSTAPSDAVVGGSYAVSATGGGSGNPVVFSIDATSTAGACSASGSTISFTSGGTCVVDANQAGNASYSAAPQVQQSFAIARAPQAISFTSTPPADAVFGGSYAVAAVGGASGNLVTFSIDGTSTPGACSVLAATVSFTGVGTCVVDADQAGNGAYLAAPQVQQSFAIAPAPQSIAFVSTPPASAAVGGTYAAAANGGGSGNAVTFSIDAASTANACSVSGATVSFTGVGTCVLDADQPGNGTYLAAPQAQQSFTIAKGTPALTWDTPASIDFGTPLGASQLDATSPVAGTFTYAPVAGTILQPGDQTLTATFTPSDTVNWNGASASVQLSVVTTQPPITTSSSGPLTIAPGTSVALTGGSVSGAISIGSGGALFVSGGSISGPVTVGPGGVLVIDSGDVTGPLRASGDAEVVLCGATISGPLSVATSSGAIRIGATSGCAGNTIVGKVVLTDNTGGVSFVGNDVTGPVTITGNSGGFSYSGNTVSGKETVSGNS